MAQKLDTLLTGDELADAYHLAKAMITALELVARRLVDLMEADAPPLDDWNEALADAKATLRELHR